MQLEKITKLNDKSITMSKIVLADANSILIPVMNSITKFSMGETDLFLHFKIQDLETIQRLICKYVIWTDTGVNLNLFDLSENINDFMSVAIEFLEFNFGFFSQSRKILSRLSSGQASEKKETLNQNQ